MGGQQADARRVLQLVAVAVAVTVAADLRHQLFWFGLDAKSKGFEPELASPRLPAHERQARTAEGLGRLSNLVESP